MGFRFDPAMWFVCRTCRRLFPDTENLKKHKLENHLGDCLRIKCIIFEERPISEELTADFAEKNSLNLNFKDNVVTLTENELEKECEQQLTVSAENIDLPNPYIIAERLIPEKLNSAVKINDIRNDDESKDSLDTPIIDHRGSKRTYFESCSEIPDPEDEGGINISSTLKRGKLLEPETAPDSLSMTQQKSFPPALRDHEYAAAFCECEAVNSTLIRTEKESSLKYPNEDIAIGVHTEEHSVNEIISDTSSSDSNSNQEKNLVDFALTDDEFPSTDAEFNCGAMNIHIVNLDTILESPLHSDIETTDLNSIQGLTDEEEEKFLSNSSIQVQDEITKNDPPSPKLVVTRNPNPKIIKTYSSAFSRRKNVSDALKNPDDVPVPASPIVSSNLGSDSTDNCAAGNEMNSDTRSTPRRNRRQINYSESQLCKFCKKEFYTVENVEDHEKFCSYRPQTKVSVSLTRLSSSPNKNKKNSNQNSKSRRKRNKAIRESDDRDYDHAQDEETASDSDSGNFAKARRGRAKPKNNSQRTHRSYEKSRRLSNKRDSRTIQNKNKVQSHRIRPVNNMTKKKNSTKDKVQKPIKEDFTDDEEEGCSPSLAEWLRIEKEKIRCGTSWNVILIENDPTLKLSDEQDASAAPRTQEPIVCKLCRQILDYEKEYKIINHLENCYFHNKSRLRYCIECNHGFPSNMEYNWHRKYDHINSVLGENKYENPNKDQEEDSDDSINDYEYNTHAIPLGAWLKKKIEKLEARQSRRKASNKPPIPKAILVKPDPSLKNFEDITVSKENPLYCGLCGYCFKTDYTARKHVESCWLYNKSNHTYCLKCNESFGQVWRLNQHNFVEHTSGPKFPYFCNSCCQGFLAKEEFQKHTKSRIKFSKIITSGSHYRINHEDEDGSGNHSNGESLVQWLKEQKDKNPENLILLDPDPLTSENFPPISKTNRIKCKLCVKYFTVESVLKSHVQMCFKHNRKFHRYCYKCKGGEYNNFNGLKEHNFIKHSKHSKVTRSRFQCTLCPKVFLHPYNFKFHLKTHEMPEAVLKPLKCPMCDSRFRYNVKLQNHLRSHREEKTFQCPNCPSAFKSKYALKHHRFGNKICNTLQCRYCSKSFPYIHRLREHERTHTGEKPHKCPVEGCESEFPYASSLNMHKKKKHWKDLGLDPFLCPSCGKEFGLQAHLTYHIRRFHTEAKDKPFKCPEEGCGKTFSMKPDLGVHIRVHTGETPFQCEVCGKAFALNRYLKLHAEEHKEEGNDVLCHLCSKKFAGKSELKRHLKEHEKNVECGQIGTRRAKRKMAKFECDFCGLECSTKASLKKHEKIHDKNDSECEEEGDEDADFSDS